MGATNPSKLPKSIVKRDGNQPVGMYKGGGMAEKWIQKAIKKPNALHKSLGVPEGKKIPAGKLAAAAKKPGKIGKRARLAETLKGFK